MKLVLRKKFLHLRSKLSKDNVNNKSHKIFLNVKKIKEIKLSKNIGIYFDINNEVETDEIISYLFGINRNLFVPCYKNKVWNFVKFLRGNKLIKGPLGILQPQNVEKTITNNLDLVFLPGVVFSKKGHRIGYGKGVYDKILRNTKCLKVGLCFDFQVLDSFPVEKHDIPIDLVITEKRIIKII